MATPNRSNNGRIGHLEKLEEFADRQLPPGLARMVHDKWLAGGCQTNRILRAIAIVSGRFLT
jgi:hypothetical protein